MEMEYWREIERDQSGWHPSTDFIRQCDKPCQKMITVTFSKTLLASKAFLQNVFPGRSVVSLEKVIIILN